MEIKLFLILVGVCILALIGIFLIIDKAMKDANVIEYHYDLDEIIDQDYDEYSPENIDMDETLKIINLRRKLKKIEEERNENKIGIPFEPMSVDDYISLKLLKEHKNHKL